MCFRNLLKSKAKSPTENVGKLQAKAKSLGVDKASLTTSMGGIDTDHYEIYKRVREEETFRSSKNANMKANLIIFISICSLIVSVVGLFIKK